MKVLKILEVFWQIATNLTENIVCGFQFIHSAMVWPVLVFSFHSNKDLFILWIKQRKHPVSLQRNGWKAADTHYVYDIILSTKRAMWRLFAVLFVLIGVLNRKFRNAVSSIRKDSKVRIYVDFHLTWRHVYSLWFNSIKIQICVKCVDRSFWLFFHVSE